jgi:eukaryotic-like serine/threonine-protein kinase
MNERWQEIEKIFQAARYMDKSARAEYLARACAGDPALREEVESLLAHVDQVEGFLENPPVEMVAKVFGKDHRWSDASTAAPDLGAMIAHYRILRKLEGAGWEWCRKLKTPGSAAG